MPRIGTDPYNELVSKLAQFTVSLPAPNVLITAPVLQARTRLCKSPVLAGTPAPNKFFYEFSATTLDSLHLITL